MYSLYQHSQQRPAGMYLPPPPPPPLTSSSPKPRHDSSAPESTELPCKSSPGNDANHHQLQQQQQHTQRRISHHIFLTNLEPTADQNFPPREIRLSRRPRPPWSLDGANDHRDFHDFDDDVSSLGMDDNGGKEKGVSSENPPAVVRAPKLHPSDIFVDPDHEETRSVLARCWFI